ncbi:MAG: hypothetical protein SGI87_00765 [Flavobacteriales bacterium]|nr:hypothetical protein [Flavobacteriales bacterium]
MMISKKYLLVLFSFALLLNTEAQKRDSFTREPIKLVEELASMFNESRKGEGKDFIEKKFGPIWIEQPAYNVQQQQMIYETLDMMLKNKNKVYPEFEHYIRALIAFPNTAKPASEFTSWQEVLIKTINDKKFKKYTPQILESSAGLFEKRCFFQSETVEWYTSSPNYKFQFDSVPCIYFEYLDLKCYAKGDSSIIYGTGGTYFVSDDRWRGNEGKITWQRAGFDPEKTYARFNKYDIRLKGSSYNIDSVTFYNEFFNQPLLGQIVEKVIADKTEKNASYPRFESYYKRLQIKNIVENVDYDGGFTMAGNKLAGSGTVEEPAILTFYRDSKKFLVARALEFDIKPDRVNSGHSQVTFYIESDSITHPDLNLKFEKASRTLILLRSEEGISKAPFQNSYHNIDMYFEALYWHIDDPKIEMGSLLGSTQHNGAFESNTYFKKKRFDAMMGISFKHPLYEIHEFVKSTGSNEFYAQELAHFHKHSEQQWHSVLIDLNNKGFVNYDLNTHRCIVREKTQAFLENNSGMRDYDVIQFNSEVGGGHNAQLSLLNFDLMLKGVQSFSVSDSQKVVIYPRNGEVTVRKNRDFGFGGRVFAGNFEFVGNEYFFNYKDFRLDLLQVDSCRIYVDDENSPVDQYGNRQKILVKSVLRDIAGNIRIDAPTNKGGYHSKTYPQYPIFNCTKMSYVYWDDQRIQKGVYNRDKFYYQVLPFTIDSLDNFTKKDLKFDGTLVSAGIFPDIEEPLVLMADNSLGFNKSTGGGGLPAYGGKAKVTADLELDFSGLKGGGQLDFVTASANSDKFIFFPDSTRGKTKSFINREQSGKIEIPKAVCDTVDLAFFPTLDRLDATSLDTPISFFENDASLEGTLSLTPKGMTGKGDMQFSGATLSSLGFEYTRRKILADTSAFQLASYESTGLAFKTENVNSAIDFDKRQGYFKSNSGETQIEFPQNQYICFMDQFTWYMDQAQMDLSSTRGASAAANDLVIDTSEEMQKSNFFSIAQGQDSLNFLAPKAKYDLKKSIISCDKIKYIIVADSKITPDSGKVVVEKYADMRELKRAQVLSNYVTQYHQIFNADLKITGRKKYFGSGDYAYKDENKKEQIIRFDEIKVDTTLQTVGAGTIKEEDQFFLSPAFEYYGKFDMKANNKFLNFEGGVRILHNCEAIERTYLRFASEINPEEIFIPIDTNLRDMDMSRLGAGVMIKDDSPMEVYPAFLSSKLEGNDMPLVELNGFLFFDKIARRYYIGSKEKIRQPKLPGNLISLGAEVCELNCDGQMNFNVDYGMLKFKNVGSLTYKMNGGDLDAQSTSLIDFPFDDGALKRMSEQIEQFPNLLPVDITKTKFEKSLIEWLGTQQSDKLISELSLGGQLKKMPEELQGILYLADVKWTWNPVDESFQTVGPIGIASMGKKQLFRYVKGKIEIEKRRSADVLRIYIELDSGNWYFFEYKLTIMNVMSSDKDFLTILQEVKDDKRKFEKDGKKFIYQVMPSKAARDKFVARFNDL